VLIPSIARPFKLFIVAFARALNTNQGFLRIHFEDDTWATVPAKSSSTARQLVEVIARKRRVPEGDWAEYAIFACELSDERTSMQWKFFWGLGKTRVQVLCAAVHRFV
jgi:hypothetical protein